MSSMSPAVGGSPLLGTAPRRRGSFPTSQAPYTLLPTSPTKPTAPPPSNPLSRTYAFFQSEKSAITSNNRRPSELGGLLTSSAALVAKSAQTTTRKMPLLAIVLALGTCFTLGMVFKSEETARGLKKLAWLTADTRIQLTARGRPVVDFESYAVDEEWSCNPFKEMGKLVIDPTDPTGNYWQPWDEECTPSRMMTQLHLASKERKDGSSKDAKGKPEKRQMRKASKSSKPAPHYPWLVNATILLQGDSMERLHVADFCDFVGGKLVNVDPKHPASPPTYRKPMPTIIGQDGEETIFSIEAKRKRREKEDEWEDRPKSWFYTRPWYCDVEEYGATLINVFTWGMQDMEEVFQTEEFFHGPSTWIDRFRHITLPLLSNLASHLNRPQILHPTMIELASGFWDLRGFTEQDFIREGIERPYPTDSNLPFGNIGEEREKRWVGQMEEAVRLVAETFKGEKGVRDGPVITWRTLHIPKRNNYTPFSRAFTIDQLARHTLHNLRVSSLATHPTTFQSAKKQIAATLGGSAGDGEGEVDYGFDERLRVTEFGKLITGQHLYYKDFLHPDPIPGSWLWGDILLYELKRAVGRVGRSVV
ncbi:hypothetical protein MNV49_004460 [Pseudohyphozyma bogoriensis]|nr:hypothetical protein MNV49_004460 [Pseudohyphozyma bogoriensis]